MFLAVPSPLGSIAGIGGRGIGWLGLWSLRRGSGRRSGASSTWPGFVGPAVLCVPVAAGGRPGGSVIGKLLRENVTERGDGIPDPDEMGSTRMAVCPPESFCHILIASGAILKNSS